MKQKKLKVLDLFSGIGGFSYASEQLVGGFETVAFCEIDKFCQKVLKKNFPNVPIYDDVKELQNETARFRGVDIVCGGFPCQAVSQAGLRKATEDDRWLWNEMFRIIQDCKPRYVIGENVVGLVNINEGVLFEQVQSDLEKEGYKVQSFIIPACAKNAPHRRDRVWIIGQLTTNTKSNGNRQVSSDLEKKGEKKERQGFGYVFQESFNDSEDEFTTRSDTSSTTVRERENVVYTSSKGSQGWVHRGKMERGQTKQQYIRHTSAVCEQPKERKQTAFSKMGDMADGISRGLLRHFDREPKHIPRVTTGEKDRGKKLKALGNSIVPQVVAEIFQAIKEVEKTK